MGMAEGGKQLSEIRPPPSAILLSAVNSTGHHAPHQPIPIQPNFRYERAAALRGDEPDIQRDVRWYVAERRGAAGIRERLPCGPLVVLIRHSRTCRPCRHELHA